MSEISKKWYVIRAISGKEKKVKELLELEISTALRLLGVNSIFDLDETYLSKDRSFGNLNALSAFPLIDEGY